MSRQSVTVKGKRYLLVEPSELKRLERLASKAEESELPAWPAVDANGNRPALQFTRVSIARSIIEQRRALGLSQQELARLAGLRQETVSRLESGKHSPTVRTVDKIDHALKRAAAAKARASSKFSSSTKSRRG